MLNGLDLFSGIGGNSIALKGYVRTIAYCERDRYAQAVLLSRMENGDIPKAPIWDDIQTFDGKPWKNLIDIIIGGFPCQDISTAGKGEGLAGKRSRLFFEIVRLAEEIEPTFLFLENVPAIRTRGLDVVVQELTKAGYDLRWTMLSASEVGAPHKRERWFCLAAHAERIQLRCEQGRRRGSSGERSPIAGDHGEKESLADTDSSRFKRKDASQSKRRNRCVESPRSRTELANTDFQSLEVGQSWKSGQCSSVIRKGWWEFEPDVGRVAHGVSRRVDRIKCLGNAVVPIQARTAFEYLMGVRI